MFNPYLVSFQLPNRLAKANPSSSFNKRFTHSNLTVSCTVCLHYLYRFQGSLALGCSLNARVIISKPVPFVNCFFYFLETQLIDFISNYRHIMLWFSFVFDAFFHVFRRRLIC